jgi:predicted phage tail component-like protein
VSIALEAPTITIDGTVLNTQFRISEIKRPFPPFNAQSVEIDGRDGSVLKGVSLGTRSVSFRLWSFSQDHNYMYTQFQMLLELLVTSFEHQLIFSDELGLVRTVTLVSELDFDEYVERGSILLEFVMYDQLREYEGQSMTISVPSGGSAQFVAQHSNPHILVTAQAAQRDASTEMWSLTFDEGDYVRLKLPTALATTVSIDCKERRVLVGGEVSMLTLESDWPRLAAGTHTVRMDLGTGAATISIRERCL